MYGKTSATCAMTDYSAYLQIDGTDEPGEDDDGHQHHRRQSSAHPDPMFVHEQHAIYASCTNYFGAASASQAAAVRQVAESMQQRQCDGKETLKEATPLLAAADGKRVKPMAVSADSVYKPTKKAAKKTGVWLSLFVLFYVFYLVLGSVAFAGMEVNSEVAERQEFREVRKRFLQKYSNVLGRLVWLYG